MSFTVESDGAVYSFPPFVDCHVHFREPGLESKADMRSESLAAFYGGVSAVCDMPNTKPPTQSIAELQDKVDRADQAAAAIAASAGASGVTAVRIFFFFGATAMEHLGELEALWTQPTHAALRARCSGLKLYLDNSTGNLRSSTAVTEAAFALCGRLHIPLVAHCEQAEINSAAAAAHPYDGPASHSQRRPPESEVASIEWAIALARTHRTPLHVAHLSTAGGLDAVRAARAADKELHLTCEVAPHHLFLSTADYPQGCGCCSGQGWVKVNPPVRDRLPHVEALWEGVLDGTVDCIATDHAPHLAAEKEAAAGEPPSGMPGVEFVLPLLLTVAAGEWPTTAAGCTVLGGGAPRPPVPRPAALASRTLRYEDIVRLMHTNPCRIFGLHLDHAPSRAFRVKERWQVELATTHSKCGWTPYEGWILTGRAVV